MLKKLRIEHTSITKETRVMSAILSPLSVLFVYCIAYAGLFLISIALSFLSWLFEWGNWNIENDTINIISWFISSLVFSFRTYDAFFGEDRTEVVSRSKIAAHVEAAAQSAIDNKFSVKESYSFEKKLVGRRTIMANRSINKILIVTGGETYDEMVILPENIIDVSLVVGYGDSAGSPSFAPVLSGLMRAVLNVTTNIPHLPLLSIVFHESGLPIARDSWLIKGVVEKAELWTSIFKAVSSKA